MDLIQENPIPRVVLACSSAMRNRCLVLSPRGRDLGWDGDETSLHQLHVHRLSGSITVGFHEKGGLGSNRIHQFTVNNEAWGFNV